MKAGLWEEMENEPFPDLPYSRQTDEARQKIEKAWDDEYARARETETSLSAAGRVLSRYGSFPQAGALVGYTAEELSDMEKNEGTMSVRTLTRRLRWAGLAMGILAFFAAVLLVEGTIYLVGIGNMYMRTLVILLLGIGAGTFFVLRAARGLHYQSVRLAPDAYALLRQRYDRYTKRLLNYIIAAMAGAAYLVFFAWGGLLTQRLSPDEAFQMVTVCFWLLELALFLIFRNLGMRALLSGALRGELRGQFSRRTALGAGCALLYWAAVWSAVLLAKEYQGFYADIYYAALAIYAVLWVTYDLTLRRGVVFVNRNVNKKRAAALVMCALLLLVWQGMRMDRWLMQPYISRVSRVPYQADRIEYSESDGVYTITTGKQNFKILQLTDIHLGGGALSVAKDYQALDAVYRLICAAEPDLVVVTGDLVYPVGISSLSLNNTAPMTQFAAFMRNVGIPWVFTYGNHDTEHMANATAPAIDTLLQELSFKTTGNFLYPYVQPQITGRNNQRVDIRDEDGRLNRSLFLLDSNAYQGEGFSDYDYIHDDQVDWYRSQVTEIRKAEGRNVPSLLFFHIPLQEYRTAYDLYLAGSSRVRYFFGENREDGTGMVCCSDTHSKLFDAARKLGSTDAMFCGHDHYNNISLEYEGIRLTYGLSIDYLAMPGIDRQTAQRGATLITLGEHGAMDIEQIHLADVLPEHILTDITW